ncbi:MAG: hypothetical protein RBT59_05295 [Arcobacteraceae bacterium]|jgi:cellulose biosynthesis protein BcsQ|nr:hypothetical protein [Arcobacteraceae bacterium]
MIISVLNKKGGVGKTPISFSLAKDLGYFLQSNDNSVVENIYPDMAKITSKPQLIENCVYDFGGFVDAGILDIIKNSDVVIVPCVNEYNSILRTVETIDEIKPFAKAILVVATKTDKEADFKQVQSAIEEYFEDIHFFELKNSKIFKNAIETGLSLTELYNENALSKSAYKTVYNQYLTVLEIFKNN